MEGQELAERHIDLRERAGLTQEQEAKMAGVSPTTISGIESGKITRPHLKTLLKIARALGTDVGELRGPGKLAAAQPGRRYLIPRSAVEGLLRPAGDPPSLDATDKEFARMVAEADENQLAEMKRDLSGHLPKGGPLPLPQPTRRELLAMDRSILIYREQKRLAAAGEEYLQELAAAITA